MNIDIAVVDYGMGNLRSVSKAIEHVAPGKIVKVTSHPNEIAQAKRVVFPGQGAMPDCIRELNDRGLHDTVIDAAKTKPFLGICIGLQMLFQHSAEGDVAGLGVMQGEVKKFTLQSLMDETGIKLKVPHMGWNEVYQQKSHVLWQDIPDAERFYFVHSYYVAPKSQQCVAAYTKYPVSFSSAVAQDNIFAVQFHPEKSAHAGLQLLRNFVNWKP